MNNLGILVSSFLITGLLLANKNTSKGVKVVAVTLFVSTCFMYGAITYKPILPPLVDAICIEKRYEPPYHVYLTGYRASGFVEMPPSYILVLEHKGMQTIVNDVSLYSKYSVGDTLKVEYLVYKKDIKIEYPYGRGVN